MLVCPQCVGRPEIDPAPGDLPPSSTGPGYEPIEVEVTERATGPRWASYQPISASVEPSQVAPDGTVVVTATCPGDALPGLGRVIVRGTYTGPTGDDPVLAMLEVPVAAYTSDPAAGTHTYVFSIDASLLVDLDPPGTFLGPACTPGVDGGPPPLGSQSLFSVSVVDPPG